MSIEPVTLTLKRHHEFGGRKVKNARCKVCRRGQDFIEHLGFPQQLDNDCGTHPIKWQEQKKMWQAVYGEALHASGLPREGVESVQVVVMYTFGVRERRDRDNFFYPFAKFFGDTLVRGRYREIPYGAVDWSLDGSIGGRKTLRRLVVNEDDEVQCARVEEFRGQVQLIGRNFDAKKPVVVQDPLGGWLADDSGERFQVIDFQAQFIEGVEAHEVLVMPSEELAGGWETNLTAPLGGVLA
jgi:hypothetical protein